MVGQTVRRCTLLGRAIRHRILAIFFATAVVVVWQMPQTATAQSGAHGDGHAENHDAYKGWQQPGSGMSCCSNADCRPTRAYPTEDGWRAWNGQTWLLVPRERVLPTDLAGDGRSHICEARNQIFCFTPGQVRG